MSETLLTSTPPATTVVHTACPLDCPDACSLTVEVADGRVARIEGSHTNPLTAGFICNKVRRFAEHLDAPERLLHPGLRRGAKGEGRFERLSWDAALDLLAEKLRDTRDRYGGEAILPLYYGGSNGLLTQETTDARLFRRLGASQVARALCSAPTRAAAQGLYGRMPGVALPDYVHARLIVLWGHNPTASGIHLVPVLEEARRRGARLVVVDPRRIPLAKRAHLHLPLRPGTDLPLALAVLRWLFENGAADREFLAAHAVGSEELERRAAPWTLDRAAAVTGLAAAEIESFARLYAESRPAVIRLGWGAERNRNGGSATAAVLALPAVAGKFKVRGGGFTLSNGAAWSLADAAAAPPPPTRTINLNRAGQALTAADPPVRLLFAYNCNPLATFPHQELVRRGLAREDLFTVVFEQVLTDTARYADLVLPATTFLEHDELVKGYGSMLLYRTRPAVPPAGEARSNVAVFAEFLRRLGLARPGDPETPDELTAAVLAPSSERVRAELAAGGVAEPDFGPSPIAFVDLFPRTADGKVHLVPAALDREAPRGLYAFQEDPATAAFPLALLSPATHRTISSSLGELHRGQVALELHPDDAARRGIADGDRVRVWNDLGEVLCLARRNPDLLPGVVHLPKGLWSHNTLSGTTANAVAPDTLADLGGGACFNDARVEVARVG